MENIILGLYGQLILTVFSFTLPILAILLSFFPEGMKSLLAKYENEKKQSESNISSEVEKRNSEKGLDYKVLEETLRVLKRNKRQAENKLSYLKPLELIIKVFLPLVLAFSGVVLYSTSHYFPIMLISIIISILGFLRAMYVLWIGMQILVEVSGVINESKKDSENKIIELLSSLVEKDGADSLFIKPEKINIKINNENLTTDTKLQRSVNNKHELSVSISNVSGMMAKNIEIGFIFPSEFLIEKTSNITSITNVDNSQIIRFFKEFVQDHEDNRQGKIHLTCLKIGSYTISAFIKGENVKSKYFKFKFEVVE